jgi:hypothetical protein
MRALSELDLLEHEVHCSHTSVVEVKNVWNFISAAPHIFKCLLCHYTYKLVLLLFSTSFAMGNFEFYENLQMSSFPVFKKKKKKKN